MAWQTDYCLMKEGMSILRGRKSVPGLSSRVPRSVINQVTKEKIHVAIHPEYQEQTIAIGSTLTEEGQKELCGLLRHHLDVFTWKPADMAGVPRHIAEHRLNVREGCLPIRQKKRRQAPERNKAISEEVKKLVEADIMKEVHYHSWLSNPVMVKKHDDNWRMYVDFKDLNKVCPKDGYPLSEIDWKVTSLCGYPYKCFLDAYKGYHQIKMAREDEKKTAFIESQGIFYDLVIKSRTKKEVIRDIEETFKTLREINMKLNPKKCAFGMREGTFLGYKVDADGLRVCPDKVEMVLDLPSPKCLKDVQKLNGKLASLNKFLSKSAEKSLPFFKTLKKCTKKTAKEAINAVLMTERDEKRARHSTPTMDVSKRTILADFIVERPKDDTPDTSIEDMEELPDPWILFTDGSSCIDGSRAGLIITNPERMEFTYALRFRFNATNNEAEYEALIAGLRIAEQMGVQNLKANVDSKLVANQVNGIYIAKESSMIKYLEKRTTLAFFFSSGRIPSVRYS
nr:reverse transcriptase domain-containing protein [Tanacetum cinerariifolium]